MFFTQGKHFLTVELKRILLFFIYVYTDLEKKPLRLI